MPPGGKAVEVKRVEVRRVEVEGGRGEGVSPHLDMGRTGGAGMRAEGAYRDHVVRGGRKGLGIVEGRRGRAVEARWFREKPASGGLTPYAFQIAVSDRPVREMSAADLAKETNALKASIRAGKEWLAANATGRGAVRENVIQAYQRLLSLMAEKRSRMMEEKKANVDTWDYKRNQDFWADYKVEDNDKVQWTEDYRQFLNGVN